MTIDGPSGRLFVDDGGSGRGVPVFFIHSLAGNTTQWGPQLAHLRPARRAAALDLRGHGRSDVPDEGEYWLTAYAADVRQAMDALGIQRAVLVGHSFGAGVAIAFAGLWGERTAGLLLVDPIDDPSKRPADASTEAFLSQLEGDGYAKTITGYWTQTLQDADPGVRRKVLADLEATPQQTVVSSMRAMAGFDASSALAGFRQPMLTITSPSNEFPSSLHHVIPGLRQETMSGVSHWLHLDRPDAFNAVLDRFLRVVDQE